MPFNIEPVAKDYPTYAQFEGKLDPNKTYLTVKNYSSEKVGRAIESRLSPEAMMRAPDDIVGNYFKDNTIQHAFDEAGGFEDSGMSNEEFHMMMEIAVMEEENGILIIDGDTVVIENTEGLRPALEIEFGQNLTITEDTADIVQGECDYQRGLEDLKRKLIQQYSKEKSSFSIDPKNNKM